MDEEDNKELKQFKRFTQQSKKRNAFIFFFTLIYYKFSLKISNKVKQAAKTAAFSRNLAAFHATNSYRAQPLIDTVRTKANKLAHHIEKLQMYVNMEPRNK